MQNKLQELTERLYNEGLSKGKEEGEKLLASARDEAARLVEQARSEAARIVEQAGKDAEALRQKAESDVRTASEQALQATRKDIENLLVSAVSAQDCDKALSDPDFLKEIIRSVAERFDASEPSDISLILPEKLQAELEPWVRGELATRLKHGISASFSKKTEGGFSIGPAEGGWHISLTDATFRELIAAYLRPVTRKLLFGE